MGYNERLMNESLKGDDDSLDELKFYAGSGDCEAQYFLAMYYAKSCGHLHNSDYWYWLEKSQENGYVPGVGKPISPYSYDGEVINMDLIDYMSWISHLYSMLSLL